METKFKEIKVTYKDGTFDYFTNATVETTLNYLKEAESINEIETIELYL